MSRIPKPIPAAAWEPGCPSAILVIQNGMTRLMNIRHQDAMTKALDMVPDLLNRFVGGKDISPEAMEKAEDMKAGYEAEAKEEK